MILQGDGFLLRRWLPGDEPSLARYAGDPAIARGLSDAFPSPYLPEHAREWVADRQMDPDPITNFAIVVDDEAVGGVGVHPKSGMYACKASLGYWLGRPFWGRGIVSAALPLVVDHAFGPLGLHRVEALVFTFNPASARVLEKAGFVREATLRANAVKDGRVVDTHLYGRVRSK